MFLERWDKMYALQGLHKKSFHKKRKIAFAAVYGVFCRKLCRRTGRCSRESG